MDEFNYLAGACPRFGTGRFRPDAVSPRLEENDLAMTQLPENVLRRFGGGLVVAGVVVYYMLRKTIG